MRTQLLAIMFTDLRGFTAYSSTATSEDIRVLIDKQKTLILPLLARHRGRLVKWIGDAAMATFDSATHAVLCGHEIQEACMAGSDQAAPSLRFEVKAVVHLGDVYVDSDGDTYGTPVNVAARLEKVAVPGEVYFTDEVRRAIPPSELPFEELPQGSVPLEAVGEYSFKGVPDKVRVFRTCFGHTPVVCEQVTLVQTDCVGVLRLADEHGWDTIQPIIDNAIGTIVTSTRDFGGTIRGVSGDGCFLTFTSMQQALHSIAAWKDVLHAASQEAGVPRLAMRVAVHAGTLHVMRNTTMGRDMHLVETLVHLGSGDELLLTGEAIHLALSQGFPADRALHTSLPPTEKPHHVMASEATLRPA